MWKCAIMQPTFNPWLGYFDMLDQCDVFVLYDDVQLSKQSWQVRNRIKTSAGELFLSVPYLKSEKWSDILICNAATNDVLPWRKKHLRSIENSYCKAFFFDEVYAFVERAYSTEFNTISSFNTNIIEGVSRKIGIKTLIVNSTTIPSDGAKDERLVKICNFLSVDKYLSPPGAAVYIEEYTPGGELAKAGIDVFYHSYKHPEYSQLHGSFIPYMGIFDALFNVGFENCLELIRSGRQDPVHYTKFKR